MSAPAKPAFEPFLTPDALSALMRSTWTWDDRALRRDLSVLLVGLDAARAADAEHADALFARSHAAAARFVASVLGPKLIADTGNPLRSHFLADTLDSAHFERTAAAALARFHTTAPAYIEEQTRALDYPAERTWTDLVTADGAHGLGAAMRAYGNGLSASTFYASMGLAWQTLGVVTGDSSAVNGYADELLAGTMTATLAAAEHSGSWDPALVKTRATEVRDGWHLTGLKQVVPAADGADVIFVIGRSMAGPSLFAVEGAAPGLTVTPLDVIDHTRPLYQVELSDTPAVLLGAEGAGGRLMTRAIDLATTALAGEQVGLIERSMSLLVTDDAVGRPDVTDRVTRVALDHVAAAALWRHALSEDAAGSPGGSAAAAAAHIVCSAAALRATTAVAELLGPSKDTDALLRRGLSANLIFGGPAVSHERHLERLGL